MSQDSFKTRKTLTVGGRQYDYFSLPAAAEAGIGDVARLPVSLKILLENLLRFEDGNTVTEADIRALGNWASDAPDDQEIAYRPARVLMQDFTGVPAVADLAAMRSPWSRRARPGHHQPAVAGGSGHRPLGDGGQVRLAQAFERTSRWRWSAITSATGSCAGGRRRSTTSAWCRRAPASATR
jgi:hypothetical protein